MGRDGGGDDTGNFNDDGTIRCFDTALWVLMFLLEVDSELIIPLPPCNAYYLPRYRL